MKRHQFTKILFNQLNLIAADNLAGLHGTVDASKLWDGKFDENDARRCATNIYRNVGYSYQINILLSIGNLGVRYEVDVDDEVKTQLDTSSMFNTTAFVESY